VNREANTKVRPEATKPETPGCGTLLMSFTAGLGLALLVAGIGRLLTDSIAITALLVEVGFLAGVVLFLAISGRDVAQALRLGRVPTAAYPLALKLGVALLIANFAATVLLGPPTQDIDFVAQADSLAERIILALTVALAAPVIEEALFRGMFQGVLETRLRPWFAIAVASMGFALLHGRDASFFFFFWSLPVGWVTWRSGSIRPAVVVHAVNNLVGFIGLMAAGQVDPESVEYEPGALIFAAIVLAAIALWAFSLTRRLGAAAAPIPAPRVEPEGSEPAGL
jgi:membrane protease YdiL (CAAX protease family)